MWVEGDELIGAEFPRAALLLEHMDVDLDPGEPVDGLDQGQFRLRRWGIREIVRHAHPQIDRAQTPPLAGDGQEPEDADGPFVGIGIDVELAGQLSVLGIGHHRQGTGVRHLGVEPAEQDHEVLGPELSEDEGEELPPLQPRFVTMDDGDRQLAEAAAMNGDTEIGRASCRERVLDLVVGGYIKKKKETMKEKKQQYNEIRKEQE